MQPIRTKTGRFTIEAMRSWDKPMVWETWKERGQSGGNRLAGVLFWRNDHCLELNFDIEWQCTSIGRGRGEDAVRKAMHPA